MIKLINLRLFVVSPTLYFPQYKVHTRSYNTRSHTFYACSCALVNAFTICWYCLYVSLCMHVCGTILSVWVFLLQIYLRLFVSKHCRRDNVIYFQVFVVWFKIWMIIKEFHTTGLSTKKSLGLCMRTMWKRPINFKLSY